MTESEEELDRAIVSPRDRKQSEALEAVRRARRFRLGAAIGQSFGLSFERMPALLLLSVVFYAPYVLWLCYSLQRVEGSPLDPWWQPLNSFLSTLSSSFLGAALCVAVSRVPKLSNFRVSTHCQAFVSRRLDKNLPLSKTLCCS